MKIKLDFIIAAIDEMENGKDLQINEALAIVSCLELGEFGATTGKPRVCGSLDLLHLKNQVNYDSNYVCISCIDRLDGLSKVPVITGYKFTGETTFSKGKTFNKGDIISLDDFLPDENILKNCIPIYKILNGWKNSKKLTTKDKLDENLENFIEFVETNTGAEIISFGNGPKSDELVYLNKN